MTKMILITKTLAIFPLRDFPLLAAKLAEQEQPSQGHATSAALVIRPIRSHINQYSLTSTHVRLVAVPSNSGIRKEQSNI